MTALWHARVKDRAEKHPTWAAEIADDLEAWCDGTLNRLYLENGIWQKSTESLPDLSGAADWSVEASRLERAIRSALSASPNDPYARRLELLVWASGASARLKTLPKEEREAAGRPLLSEFADKFARIVELDPENDGCRFELASWIIAEVPERRDEAVRHLEFLRKRGNWAKNRELLELLRECYEEKGDKAAHLVIARDELAWHREWYEVAAKDPKYRVIIEYDGPEKFRANHLNWARIRVAELCVDNGVPDEARALAVEAIRDFPDDADAHVALGRAYVALGNRPGALDEYRMVNEIIRRKYPPPLDEVDKKQHDRLRGEADKLYKLIYP